MSMPIEDRQSSWGCSDKENSINTVVKISRS